VAISRPAKVLSTAKSGSTSTRTWITLRLLTRSMPVSRGSQIVHRRAGRSEVRRTCGPKLVPRFTASSEHRLNAVACSRILLIQPSTASGSAAARRR